MTTWLSVEAVGHELGLGYKTVCRIIDRGELVAYRFGRVYRVKATDLDVYLESARVKPGAMLAPRLRSVG